MLFEGLSKLRARTCPGQFEPWLSWQCVFCLSLNWDEDDADSDNSESGDGEEPSKKVRCDVCRAVRDTTEASVCATSIAGSSGLGDASCDGSKCDGAEFERQSSQQMAWP
jgi:hypothetical protein